MRGIRRLRVQPHGALVALEPADLATRVAPRQGLRLRDRLALVQLTAELRERLRVADGA